MGNVFRSDLLAGSKLEHLLRLPPLAITLLWLTGFVPWPLVRSFTGPGWHVNVAPIYSPAILSALLIFAWTYALYEASRSRTSSASPRNGRKLFAVTACGFLFVLPLAHIVYVWDGDPPGAALAALGLALLPTVMGLFVVFWLASEALSTFEARVAAPGSSQPDHPFLAILFIGIGVWFLRGRIERMLDHALAEVVT